MSISIMALSGNIAADLPPVVCLLSERTGLPSESYSSRLVKSSFPVPLQVDGETVSPSTVPLSNSASLLQKQSSTSLIVLLEGGSGIHSAQPPPTQTAPLAINGDA